jgi:hypothetical protein
MPIT